jgi:rhomboid protease GluP
MARARLPPATLALFTLTATFSALEFPFPILLASLRRTPTALEQHEWWRLITPLFVHAGRTWEILFNLGALLVVGTLAERAWGSSRTLAIYLACGVVGELAGYAWKPSGAGASVGISGLLGSLAAWLIAKPRTLPAYGGGAILVAGAAAFTLFHDLHGPPILAGVGLGLVAAAWERGSRPPA